MVTEQIRSPKLRSELLAAFLRHNRMTDMQAILDSATGLAHSTIRMCHLKAIGWFSAGADQYGLEMWIRDVLGLGSLLAPYYPEPFLKSVETVLAFTKADGQVPRYIGYKRHVLQYVPGLRCFSWLIRRNKPHANYNRQARDLASSLIIGCAQAFRYCPGGQELVKQNWDLLKRALEREAERYMQQDKLLRGRPCQCWIDCIKRKGKLSTVNVLWYAAHKEMAYMAKHLGYETDRKHYHKRGREILASCKELLWTGDYLQASEKDSRLDTSANLFATLYLPVDMVRRILSSLDRQSSLDRGFFKPFDRPYPIRMLCLGVRLAGHCGYGNTCVYPWMSGLYALGQLRIATITKNLTAAEESLSKAIRTLVMSGYAHVKANGFYEILDPDSGEPIIARRGWIVTYRSNSWFLGSAAPFLAAFFLALRLGLLQETNPQ